MANTNLPYKNPDLPIQERIADLLGRMTLEEKVGQMMQLDARNGNLDDIIINKHVGSILHTSPADLPRAVGTVNTKTQPRHPTDHRRRLHPRLFLLARLHHLPPPSWAWPQASTLPRCKPQAAPPPRRYPPPVCIGRSLPYCASPATPAGAAWTRPSAKTRIRSARWRLRHRRRLPRWQPRPASHLPRMRFWPAPSSSAGYSETQGGRDASEADSATASWNPGSLPPFERVAEEGCGTSCVRLRTPLTACPVTFNKWLLSDKLRGDWKLPGRTRH